MSVCINTDTLSEQLCFVFIYIKCSGLHCSLCFWQMKCYSASYLKNAFHLKRNLFFFISSLWVDQGSESLRLDSVPLFFSVFFFPLAFCPPISGASTPIFWTLIFFLIWWKVKEWKSKREGERYGNLDSVPKRVFWWVKGNLI